MKPSLTHLWLVRHGQTDWNLAGRIQGQSDVPLNETGRQQAENLAKRLTGNTFDAVYCSDLARAHQTALTVTRSLKLPVRLDPRLREIHQGEWEGQLINDLLPHENRTHSAPHNPVTDRAPGGETLFEVALRAVAAIEDICQSHPGGKILVVSHGLCLAAIICHVERRPLDQAYKLIPDHCTPQVICWSLEP